jgi:hypothetical protein
MQRTSGYGLIPGLVIGLSLALLPLVADEAAAQVDIAGEECGGIAILCQATENESSGGDATGGNGGNGGRGGNGGFASVHDIANAHADASSSVIVGDITTGDAFGHNINVDATGANAPVVLAIAGSFSDTGVDIFAPGGNAQSGTTGGNGLSADASGGDGGDGGNGGNATGGDGGDITSSQALAAAVEAIIIDIVAVAGAA